MSVDGQYLKKKMFLIFFLSLRVFNSVGGSVDHKIKKIRGLMLACSMRANDKC